MLTTKFFSEQLAYNYLCKYIYAFCMLVVILFKHVFVDYILFLPKLHINIITIVALKKKNIFKHRVLKFKRLKRAAALYFSNASEHENLYNFPKIIFKNHKQLPTQPNFSALALKLYETTQWQAIIDYIYNLKFFCNVILDFTDFFEETCIFKNSVPSLFKHLTNGNTEILFYKSMAKVYPKKPMLKNSFIPDWNWSLPRLANKLLLKKFFLFKTLKLSNSIDMTTSSKNKSAFIAPRKKISLNFKYKFNFIYKLIRRNFFLKLMLNDKTVKYFLKFKKRKIIDNLHNFFNIGYILNFFFTNVAHQKLLISANCVYLNGYSIINKNKKLNLFDIIQLPISLNILNFFLYCTVFNKSLLQKLITKISQNNNFYKKKAMLINKSYYPNNCIELDYLSMSCVILKIPKNLNFFKINSLNLFFYKTYAWKK